MSLPARELLPDADAPGSIAEAAEWSDYVILAEIAGVQPGLRFYGRTAEDPLSVGYEDVGLDLEIVERIQGDPPNTLRLRWPGYQTDGSSTEQRTATLNAAGVNFVDRVPTGRYLFFVKEYAEPFGLSVVSLQTAVIEINDEGVADGQISTRFEQYRGLGFSELVALASGDVDDRNVGQAGSVSVDECLASHGVDPDEAAAAIDGDRRDSEMTQFVHDCISSPHVHDE